eukprot:jgi/Picsp_1/5196/NSC_02559-R1_actin-related protein arp7
MAENSCVVIDLGSQDIKAGFAYSFPSEYEPQIVLPNAVIAEQDIPQALEHEEKGSLYYVRPIVQGEIKDFEGLEAVIRQVLYYQSGWSEGSEENVVIVEPALTPRLDRERLTQILFEKFNVNSLFVTDAAVASLYSVGKTGGIVVDIGYEKIDVVPVIDGLAQPSSATRIPFGGRHLTEKLQDFLKHKDTRVSFEEAEILKLDICNREKAAEAGTSDAVAHEFCLPDGQRISLQEEIESMQSLLLDPTLSGLDMPTVAETCINAGMVTTVHGERDSRRALMENIFVCGAGSGFPGISESLLKRVTEISHASLPPALRSSMEYMPKHSRARAAWFGGAAIGKVVHSQTNQMQNQTVSKFEYHEYGPTVIHRKCS